MKKIILLLVMVLLVGAGGYYYVHHTNGQEKPLVFYGNIENRTQDLSFRFLGTIKSIRKDEGESFTKGEPLVLLDTTTLRYQLENLTAQLVAEKATLAKLTKGYRVEEISQAKASAEETKAALEGAHDVYVRQQKLFKVDATTEQEYITAKTQYDKATASYAKALSYYDMVRRGYQVEDIEAQNAKVMALAAQAKSLEHDIEDATLYAPTEGTVLARYKEPSSIVSAAQSILEIALEDEYWVKAYVDEPLLGKITQGETLWVYIDSRKEPYEGSIGFISPVAEFTPKNIETMELRPDLVYRFRVIIKHPDAHLKQGMPVTIKPKKET
jgi:HlyD family secretion protein